MRLSDFETEAAKWRLREHNKMSEAPYKGNVGIMELIKFQKIATPEQKAKFNELVDQGAAKEAWALIQEVTGVKLYTNDIAVAEVLKQVNGKWALVSKSNPKKVLQYYDGPSGKRPSKSWVDKVERRIHAVSESRSHENGTYSSLQVSDESAEQIINWCKKSDIVVSNPNDLHCTLIYSKTPVPELDKVDGMDVNIAGEVTEWDILGGDCLVLLIKCPGAELLNKEMTDKGATSDYDEYIAHVTITTHYESEEKPDGTPDFDIMFDSVKVNELEDDWNDK